MSDLELQDCSHQLSPSFQEVWWHFSYVLTFEYVWRHMKMIMEKMPSPGIGTLRTYPVKDKALLHSECSVCGPKYSLDIQTMWPSFPPMSITMLDAARPQRLCERRYVFPLYISPRGYSKVWYHHLCLCCGPHDTLCRLKVKAANQVRLYIHKINCAEGLGFPICLCVYASSTNHRVGKTAIEADKEDSDIFRACNIVLYPILKAGAEGSVISYYNVRFWWGKKQLWILNLSWKIHLEDYYSKNCNGFLLGSNNAMSTEQGL